MSKNNETKKPIELEDSEYPIDPSLDNIVSIQRRKSYIRIVNIGRMCLIPAYLYYLSLAIYSLVMVYTHLIFPMFQILSNILLILFISILTIGALVKANRFSAQIILAGLIYIYFVAFGALPGEYWKIYPNYSSYLIGHYSVYILLFVSAIMWLAAIIMQTIQFISLSIQTKKNKIKYNKNLLTFNTIPRHVKSIITSRFSIIFIGLIIITGSSFWMTHIGAFKLDSITIQGEQLLSDGSYSTITPANSLEILTWGEFRLPGGLSYMDLRNTSWYFGDVIAAEINATIDTATIEEIAAINLSQYELTEQGAEFLNQLGRVNWTTSIGVNNATSLRTLAMYEPFIRLWEPYGMRLGFTLWTVGFQTSRTMYQWIRLAHWYLDWIEARGYTNIQIWSDSESGSPWAEKGWNIDYITGIEAPNYYDVEYDVAVALEFDNLMVRARSLGIEFCNCPTGSGLYDDIDGDFDMDTIAYQMDSWDWDRHMPQLYDGIPYTYRELTHIHERYDSNGINRANPCLSPLTNLTLLREQIRLCRFFGVRGVSFWPAYCYQGYATPIGLSCPYAYGGSPVNPSLNGVYAIIDEACKPIEELEPIVIRTSTNPDETIPHFIEKLHGDRLFIQGDIIRDLGFNSWENGIFIIVWTGFLISMIVISAYSDKILEREIENKKKMHRNRRKNDNPEN